MAEHNNLLLLADVASGIYIKEMASENHITIESSKHKQVISLVGIHPASNEVKSHHEEGYPVFQDAEKTSIGEVFHSPDVLSAHETMQISPLFQEKKKQEKQPSFVLDHSYSLHHSKSAARKPKASVGKLNIEKVTVERTLPQFIILTPPFPYVHGSSDIQVVEISEIRYNGEPVDYKRKITVDPQLYSQRVISSVYSKKQSNLSSRNKKRTRLSNKIDVTGSVLECVENRIDIKLCQPSTSKGNNFTSNNNFENLENVQTTDEKSKAMELIDRLTQSKKKKGTSEPLTCEICIDKNFTTMPSLINHYRSHAGIRRYACEYCERTFTRLHSLKYHIMVHLGTKHIVCKICKRKFRHNSHFKEHFRSHTGETPFKCLSCDREFKSRNTYKRHLQTIHNKKLIKLDSQDMEIDDTSNV